MNPRAPSRKPRSDSPLRLLPWDRQARIVKALETTPTRDVIADLAATDHITASESTLSKFRTWHLDRIEARAQRLADDLASVQTAADVANQPISQPDMRKFEQIAVILTWVRAYEQQDTAAILRLVRSRQLERALDLNERRVALKEYEKELECLKFEDEVATAANRTRIFCQALPEICRFFAKAEDPNRQVSDEEIEREVRKIWNIKPKPDPAATPENPPTPGTPSLGGSPAPDASGPAPAAVSPPACEPAPADSAPAKTDSGPIASDIPHPASGISDSASPIPSPSAPVAVEDAAAPRPIASPVPHPASPSGSVSSVSSCEVPHPPKPVWEPSWATAEYTARSAGKPQTPPPPGLTMADLRSQMIWNKRCLVFTERGLELCAKDFYPVVLHRLPLTPEIVWWAVQDLRNGLFAV